MEESIKIRLQKTEAGMRRGDVAAEKEAPLSEYTREEILKLIEENGGPEGLDLSGKDLSGIDLGREAISAELERAREWAPGETPVWYFSGILGMKEGINLRGAKLQETNLGSAALRGADLRFADLHGAYLGYAKLQEADLGYADLQGAYLFYAKLQGAELGGVNLQGAYLRDAKLQGANLRFADLQEADLWDADLQGANLRDAKLQGANLRFADLQKADLWDASLQGVDLGGANLQGAYLTDAKLQGANLRFADLQEANLRDAKLQGADLGNADLQGVRLEGANLQGAALSNSHLEKVDFFGAKSLKGAYFYNAFLDGTRLKKEQLEGAIGEDLDRGYYKAKEAYLALKNNFAEIGRYDDAAWAYRKERRMEKLAALHKAKDAWQKHDWKEVIPHYAKVLGDQLVECLCDYGEGIWRVAGSLIAVWSSFALIYGLIAGVWGPWQDTDFGKIRYITRNPIDLLSFSLGAMTTLEPIGVEARPILAMRILAPLESLLSIFLGGLLGFVAGKRIRRS